MKNVTFAGIDFGSNCLVQTNHKNRFLSTQMSCLFRSTVIISRYFLLLLRFHTASCQCYCSDLLALLLMIALLDFSCQPVLATGCSAASSKLASHTHFLNGDVRHGPRNDAIPSNAHYKPATGHS